MQTLTPIHQLKRQAKLMARQGDMPLHQALNQLAISEGFQSWSHLSAATQSGPAHRTLQHLTPGTLVLLGARPGQGKTLLGLELAAKAGRIRRRGHFFTLDYHEADLARRIQDLGLDLAQVQRDVEVDTSDNICADYMIRQLADRDHAALVVVDYLQLLDQRRKNPSLNDQVTALRTYARASGAIFVLISQIDRRFDLSGRSMPDASDIRLPNPLDLALFDQFVFLHQGRISLRPAR